MRCNDALRRAGVAAMRWFRSPVGLKNVFLAPALAQRACASSRGTCAATTAFLATRKPWRAALRGGAPGAIVLLHEGRPRSNEAILRVVDELRAGGYSFVIPADEQLV